MSTLFSDEKEIHEHCGVFGVYGRKDSAAITALGLHALQHRGQEAAGIVSFDGSVFHAEKHMGLVGDRFSRPSVIDNLPGYTAVGHVRYATSGATAMRNVQPLFAELNSGGFALAHNGNFSNGESLRASLVASGCICQSTSDTEVLLHLVARSRKKNFIDRFTEGLSMIEGAYALTAITNKKLVGARDPLGLRPLILGDLEGKPILASETCALDIIGANFIRDVAPGEVIVIDANGLRSFSPFPKQAPRPCVFEYIYFSRPDSIVNGFSVYDVRKRFGQELASETGKELDKNIDVIIPIPDSGVPAAIGYARESNIPYELGIIRNHYVGRTFIQPTHRLRESGVHMKHSINRAVVTGKRIILIDDSIVRGTTAKRIVNLMRERSAKEVHMRIASPPIRFPDYYGVDLPRKEDFIAHNRTIEEMRKLIGCDSLTFLSIDGLYRSLGSPEGRVTQKFADHCFTGDYPTPIPEEKSMPRGKEIFLEGKHW